MEQEIWKDIKGFEGFYEISNLGRVKSLERTYKTRNNKTWHVGEKILKIVPFHGYPAVVLSKNSVCRRYTIHRLIAEAFIPNPENKPHIDHINTDTMDYRLSNLRWVTHTENMNNPKTIKNKIVGAATAFKSKKIYVYDTSKSKNGKCVFSFLSPTSAARYFGVNLSAITKALDNKNKRICGYLIRSERKKYKTKSK